MSELRDIFSKLSELYTENSLTWVEIAELYDKGNDSENKESIENLSFINQTLKNPEPHLATMKELCTTIRLCGGVESRSTYYETHDCWKEISTVTTCDSYLAYIYALVGLSNINPASSKHIKLSMAAVSTYILSLTIPGAKGFHIFDDEIIAHCLQVFTLTERIQNPDLLRSLSKHQSVEIWIHLITLCDDFKILFRYVHFKDSKNVRNNILKKLINVLHLNHERGYANVYAANLHTNVFELLEELVNAHNGEPEETLKKLMNMTLFLHTYPPKPKCVTGGTQIPNQNCEHISDWFINCIAKYPRLIVKVLSFYIECVVTNPVKTYKTEQIQRALEYAAKYDAALFTKCNESCVEFLCESVYAEEVMIRCRSVELMARILQLESKVDWQLFRDEVSNIPREVHLIKELIDSLRDNNNTIKFRAVQALQSAVVKGSTNTLKILKEGIRFARFNCPDVVLPIEPRVRKNEIRFEKPEPPSPTYTFEGHGIIELSFLHLPEYIYDNIFQSSASNLRRAGIAFMEQLIMLNPLVIFETKFVSRMIIFVNEPTAIVRKQAMQTADALLNQFPCYPIIWIWCKIITPMLNDADPKNTELAMNCFHSRVLLNIKSMEQSNKAEHFMPWVIMRTMLSTGSRLYLQVCFNLALKQSLVNSKILSIIESHLVTSNSTEAWIVLNFVSGKIKSQEPDALIHMFISQPSWNKEQNMLIAIEVLANCITHFSHTALNHAFNHILNALRNGEMLPVIIGKAFDFLILIDQQSTTQSKKSESNKSGTKSRTLLDRPWIIELHEHLEQNILQGINEFPQSCDTLISHLFTYSEVNLQTRLHPNTIIISFLHKYMCECLKIEENELDSENERLFNSMIIIAGRFSLRNATVASTTINIYDSILRTRDQPSIVNTIIVSITDICKKHTQIVERIIGRILSKLASPFIINRMETFNCFEKLVLQDQLKLRDILLLSLLTVLLDENEELAARASRFFTEYITKKNNTLFHKCLTEYPFVLNEYKNFISKDSFSDKAIKSPLTGDSQRKKRHALYNYFMAEMDDVNLILYFNQLKLIAEKCKTDPFMISAEGLMVLTDIFFILKRVCQLTKEKKSSADNKGGGDNKDDDIAEFAEINDSAPAVGTSNATNPATTTTGRGRRRREVVTMEDALVILEKSLIFIPNIFEKMSSVDKNVTKYFDDLCFVIAKRFQKFVDDAQPTSFWKKYKKTIQTPSKTRSGRKRKSVNKDDESEMSNDDEDEDDEEVTENKRLNTEDNDSDDDSDDLPLIRKCERVSPSKRIRTKHPETLMDYVFHTNM